MKGKELSIGAMENLWKSERRYYVESTNPFISNGVYRLKTNYQFRSEENEDCFSKSCDSVLEGRIKVYEYLEEEIVLKRKVGDQVRIKDNLIQGYVEGTDQGNFISEKMISFGGKIAKITKLLTDGYDYELDIDEQRFDWSEYMVEDVKVQEYQTWEVIKALTENPKLKFGAVNEYNPSKIPDCIVLVNEEGDIVWSEDEDTIYLSSAHIHYKWILMEETKEVTFIEAVKAFSEGKIIVCKRKGVEERYKPADEYSTLGILKNTWGTQLNCKDVLEGKWFIEN